MFLVEVSIEKTPDKGFGVFAKQFIKKGDIIWKFVDGFDIKVHHSKYDMLTPIQKKFVDTYFWKEGEYLYSSCDHSIFQNHSSNPNSISYGEDMMMASRDIHIGDEIVPCYSEFDDDFDSYKDNLI